MSIDRAFLKESFDAYVSRFDAQDERISLKIDHTYRVAENSDSISASLGLSSAEKDVAWAIAMLHDIGRFEQAAASHSFIDSPSNDHAEAGVQFLFGAGQLCRFVPAGSCTEAELRCIELAIHYHNKHLLPEGLTPAQQLFCSIIRDADKLDIFRICLVNSFRTVHEYTREEVASSPISPIVCECFAKHETLDYSKRQYPADIFLGHIAMCFGLCFPCSRQRAAEQGYIEQMMDFTFTGEAEERAFAEMKRQTRLFLKP